MTIKVLATDAQGALSEGDNSNPAFTSPVHINDKTYVDISPPEGYYHEGYTVYGGLGRARSAAVGLCLTENGTFVNGDSGLYIGRFTDVTRIWIKALLVGTHPTLECPIAGFLVINLVEGTEKADSTEVGNAVEVEPVTGIARSDSGETGDAENPIHTAGGSIVSGSEELGDVVEVEPVSGVDVSDSSTVGTITPHTYILGSDSNNASIFIDPFTGTSGHPSGTNWQMGSDDGASGDNSNLYDFITGSSIYHFQWALAGNAAILSCPLHGILSGAPQGNAALTAKGMTISTDQVLEFPLGAMPYKDYRPWAAIRVTPGTHGIFYTNVAGTGYFVICDKTANNISVNKMVSGTVTQLGANQNITWQDGDVVRISAIGSTSTVILVEVIRSGAVVLSYSQTDTSSPILSGVIGYNFDAYGWDTSALALTIAYANVFKGLSISVTGMTTGQYIRVTDGVANSDAAWTSGTLTVPLNGCICGESGLTVKLYQGNPASGGTLLSTQTGIFGGAALAVS